MVPGAEMLCEPHTDLFPDMECRRVLGSWGPSKNGSVFETGKGMKFSVPFHNAKNQKIRARATRNPQLRFFK